MIKKENEQGCHSERGGAESKDDMSNVVRFAVSLFKADSLNMRLG